MSAYDDDADRLVSEHCDICGELFMDCDCYDEYVDPPRCPACSGTGQTIEGRICGKCEGTGHDD